MKVVGYLQAHMKLTDLASSGIFSEILNYFYNIVFGVLFTTVFCIRNSKFIYFYYS